MKLVVMEQMGTEVFSETDTQYMKLKTNDASSNEVTQRKFEYKWSNIYWFLFLHVTSLFGFYLVFKSVKWQTNVFAFLVHLMCALGVGAGAHRLWCHRTFKARLPLRVILMLWQTMSFIGNIYDWTRDHRVHHKYSDTAADPHNATRGFFYSQIGWLFYKKSPEVIKAGKGIDLRDLEADPVVMFQMKHYFKMTLVLYFVIPTIIPVYFWGESWTNAFIIPVILRHTIGIHILGLTNSFAHLVGHRPYDKSLKPTDSPWVWMACVEGFHNYHHVFPWDYRATDLPFYNMLTPTILFIEAAAWMGQAYDLKSATPEMVKQRAQKTGDNYFSSHPSE